ncbi:double homeobox protein B-like [Sciurus carolinensis]|uniref:double homeobox protein B-like n=1 Tax=Sciurus carolinensis TaxID=30640 RepID=UPI001FB3FC28|nr:double homeobox protein B-like [Sciurus carolinensis]
MDYISMGLLEMEHKTSLLQLLWVACTGLFRGINFDTWQGRIVYSQSQRKTFLVWFEYDSNPDKATREQSAKEIGITGYKIQIWFKNQRSRWKKLESGYSIGKDPIQGHDQSQLRTKECVTKEARQDQIPLTTTQRRILVQAFKRNHVPDAATRKKLAKQTGIQELSIQMWFQNQRSLYPEWSRGDPINFLVGDTSGRPELIDQLQETNLFICPDGKLLTPGEDFSDTQVPFWTQFQEECQNHKEQTVIGVIPLKDPSQPQPENKEPQYPGHIDISYIMQWWDKGHQALIQKWQTLEDLY